MNSLFKEGKWFKGNTHCHTTKSDGAHPPLETALGYKEKGYHFLAITDHEQFDSNEGIKIDDFVIIPAIERALNGKNNRNVHLVGLSDKVQPAYRTPGGDYDKEDPQKFIDEMLAAGMYVILAHPDWSRMLADDPLKFTGYSAIEVCNAGCANVVTAYSESYLDNALRKGREINANASDDCHRKDYSDYYKGFIVVKSQKLELKSIMDGIREGQYFSSEGPLFEDILYDNERIYVKSTPCRFINFIAYENHGKACGDGITPVTEGDYKFRGHEKYIRIELVDERGYKAWSNPIYLKNII